MRTTLFDLDFTLIKQDSFAELLKYLILKDIPRKATALLLSPIWIILIKFPSTLKFGASLVLWIATFGKSEHQLKIEIHDYLQQNKINIYQKGLERLNSELNEQDRIIIVTGCASILAIPLCKQLFGESVIVVGSDLQFFLGGFITKFHCYGAKKIEALSKIGVVNWEVTFTDSHSDIPILAKANKRYLINPRKNDLIKVKEKFNNEFEVLKWS